MRISLFALALVTSIGFCACDSKSSTTPTAATPGDTKVAVANTLCPVLDTPAITDDPAFTVDYKGQKIAFCCMKCPPKFKADPEKYMAKMRADPAKYGYKAP